MSLCLVLLLGLLACDEPAPPPPPAPAPVTPPAPPPTPNPPSEPEPVAPPEPEPVAPNPDNEAEPDADPVAEDEPPTGADTQGDFLPGDDDTPIVMLKLQVPATGSLNMTDDRMLKDRLETTLDLNATVGQVNAALEETGARICGFVRAIPQRARLCIPEVPDERAARAVANRLTAHRAFVHAEPIFVAGEKTYAR